MASWLEIAFRPAVVRRALRCSLLVGIILVAINHGDALLSLDLSLQRIVRMALTFVVPYLVSTSSSVSAIRELGGGRVAAEAHR